MKKLLPLLLLLFAFQAFSQVNQAYQLPPKEILDLVDIKATPTVYLNSRSTFMVLLERNNFKSLEELAAEEIGLAGIRIDPQTNGYSRSTYFSGITIQRISDRKSIDIKGLPEKMNISDLSFSPDEKKISFLQKTISGFELWVIDLENQSAKKLTSDNINPLLSGPYTWSPDSKSLLCQTIPTKRERLNEKEPLPTGPVVQETSGSKAVVRTYQDLLKNKYDESLFDYYFTSEYKLVDLNGNQKDFLSEGIYRKISWSPDGNYLLTEQIKKPYSYIVPYYRFAFDVIIYDQNGKNPLTFHQRKLLEELPKGFDAVEKGKRNISWRPDQSASLMWVEAQDNGDPSVNIDTRDKVFFSEYPFSKSPTFIAETKNRFENIKWSKTGIVVIRDSWWKSRNEKTYLVDLKTGKSEVVFDRSGEDYYGDPGSFVMTKDPETNFFVLHTSPDGKLLYLTGEGYSPEGNRPFLDEFNPSTKKTKRLWRADGKSTYEQIISVVDPIKGILLTRIQSPDEYPNYYLRTIKGGKPSAITSFQNPYISFSGVSKKTIFYKRKDGVDLSGVLYLPEGYKKDSGPFPVLMWAYPREFKSAADAGQVKESPHKFTFLYYGSPIYWAARGYAVFDRADFPIIGEGKEEPNDSFIEQLVMNAEAAIDTLAKMGIADRKRIALGGHSYGAFMTANLMAHSDLFAAGIARSGAYNRTLTPFGFQSEERTFWDNPELYMRMSPFTHAHKINEPLLLIHGAADNNPGTFTLQSERLYGAIKGLGGTSRLVLLPYESHGYAARENIFHMMWEMDTWLEKRVKNKQ